MTKQRIHKTYPLACSDPTEKASDWHTTPLSKDSTTIPAIPCAGHAQRNKPKVTVPVDLNLATSSRRRSTEADTKGRNELPIAPTSVVPLATRKIPTKKPLTIPESPNIMKPSFKKASTSEEEGIRVQPPPFKAHPVPSYAHPFKPIVKHQHSEAHSPHLPGNVIAEGKRRRFQEALQRERQLTEEARQFHARPMPDFDHFEEPTVRESSCLSLPNVLNVYWSFPERRYSSQFDP